MIRLIFLGLLLVALMFSLGCESEAPTESGNSVDTLFIFDSTFVYDTTVIYDTVFYYDTLVILDSIFIVDTLVVYDTVVYHDSTFTVDTVFVFDSMFVYDSVFVYDTVVIIDSVFIPGGEDSLVYKDCMILKCGTRIGTLGMPGEEEDEDGYFVTVSRHSRQEANGHPIKFCLYIYRQEEGYRAVLSASHLKTEWPVVTVQVEATNNDLFFWQLDKKHQTVNIVF